MFVLTDVQLGDLLLQLPAIQAVQGRHEGAEFAAAYQKAPARDLEQLGRFHRVQHAPLARSWRELIASEWALPFLRAERFTAVYDFAGLRHSQRIVALARLLGLGQGRRVESWGKRPEAARGYWHSPSLEDHASARSRLVLERMGLQAPPRPDLSHLSAPLSGELAAIAEGPPYALLVPGARWAAEEKAWTAEGFAELARRLKGEGVRPYIIGTEADRAAAAPIFSLAPGAGDLIGQTDLSALYMLLSSARLCVSIDTGAGHLSAAAGRPTLSLFSTLVPESHPDRWAAPGAQVVAHNGPMAELDVEQVWQAVKGVLHG